MSAPDRASETTASDTGEGFELLERAAAGNADAVRALFADHRERLKRVVRLRLNRLLQGRVNEAQVVDEVLDDAARRLTEFVETSGPSLFVWLRHLACEKLAEVHRRDLACEGPIVRGNGELTLHAGGLPVTDSAALMAQFLGGTLESRPADKAEARLYFQDALNSMDSTDREILAMKHFERLSFREIAQVLGLAPSSVGNRYLKAVKRLTEICPWDLSSTRV